MPSAMSILGGYTRDISEHLGKFVGISDRLKGRVKLSTLVIPDHQILLPFGTIAGFATANQVFDVVGTTFDSWEEMVNGEVLGSSAINAAGAVLHLPAFILEQRAYLQLPRQQSFEQPHSDDEGGFVVGRKSSVDAVLCHCQVGI